MEIILIVVTILLTILVLLQSGKAESAAQIVQGGNQDLFSNRKERGGELLITRITWGLGIIFFVICILMTM